MNVSMIGMFNLDKMQHKVDKLLSIFTNLIEELDGSISKLNTEIGKNKTAIEVATENICTYETKISEYKTLKSKVESIIK